METLKHQNIVSNIYFLSYELNPNMGPKGEDINDHIEWLSMLACIFNESTLVGCSHLVEYCAQTIIELAIKDLPRESVIPP